MRLRSSALAAIAVIGLSVSACGPGSAGTAAPAAPQAQAADVAGAEAFVRAVFAGYSDAPGAPSPDYPWSAGTQALMDADAEAAQGVGYLGADPICDCQDWINLRVTALAVTSTGPDSADAAVTFVNGDGAESISEILKLVRENGAWKIDDIVYGQGHSMMGQPNLREGVAASTAEILADAAKGE